MLSGFDNVIEEILDELRKLPQDVYDSEVPDDSVLRMDSGRILPHVIFMHTNPVRSARGRGIVAAKNDLYRASCSVHCVALTARDARQLRTAVTELLTDFQPTDASELVPWGGFSTNSTSSNAKPTKFIFTQGFQFLINTILDTD